jgi:hypothetical protein
MLVLSRFLCRALLDVRNLSRVTSFFWAGERDPVINLCPTQAFFSNSVAQALMTSPQSHSLDDSQRKWGPAMHLQRSSSAERQKSQAAGCQDPQHTQMPQSHCSPSNVRRRAVPLTKIPDLDPRTAEMN